MSLLSFTHDQDSVLLRIKILDSSAADGSGLTGLTSASAGLIIGTISDVEATTTTYTQAAGNIETIVTLGTYSAPTASKCRFKEVDATNHPGVYEIQLADARFAVAAAKSLIVSVSGATNVAESDALIPLWQIDPYTSGVDVSTIANSAIKNATFHSDVAATVYSSNIIALAVRKVLDELKLDRLVAVADSDSPVNDSIIAKMAATGGDWSTFAKATDSLQSIRDVAPHGTAMRGTDGASTHTASDVATEITGLQMDLVDAPNATAVIAIQDGLATQPSTEALHATTDVLINGLISTVGVSGLGLTDLGGMSTAMKAEIRTSVGLASANLDTQLADLPTVAEFGARTLASGSYFNASTTAVTTDTASRNASKATDVDANVVQFLGTAINESSAGRIAGNVELFWDNGDAQTAKTVNDVGVAGSGLTGQQVWEYATRTLTSGSGSGARTVTVTVDDGATVLENATVRFTEGVNTFTGLTNVSGVIVFSLDDATYTVSITKAGYSFTPTTKIVNGAEADTYSMAAVTITAPPNASTTTGTMTVYDEQGSVESGVTVTVQVIDGPGTAGIGYDSTEWAATSNGSGVVEFAGIILGARYKIWRGTSKPEAQTFTAPTTGTSFNLAEVIGRG